MKRLATDLFILFAVFSVTTIYFAIDTRKPESKPVDHEEQKEAYIRVVLSGLLGFCCFALWLAQRLTFMDSDVDFELIWALCTFAVFVTMTKPAFRLFRGDPPQKRDTLILYGGVVVIGLLYLAAPRFPAVERIVEAALR
jgi:hypothetical protein